MRAYERLMNYAKVYTTSDPANSGVSPSTSRQYTLAEQLVQELKQLGVENAFVDENCYVYGIIPAFEGIGNRSIHSGIAFGCR